MNNVVSITGDAKVSNLKSSLKNSLKKGIVKAAFSTKAWLITGKYIVATVRIKNDHFIIFMHV